MSGEYSGEFDTPAKRLEHAWRYRGFKDEEKYASFFGMPLKFFQDINSGKLSISAELAQIFSSNLGISEKWLLTGVGEMRIQSHIVWYDYQSQRNRTRSVDISGFGPIRSYSDKNLEDR